MTLEWDAGEYEVLAAPMTGWGARVLERLDLRGNETVLDAGCGTGRVTELLLERLPEGRVLAVDASQAMVEAARKRFAGDGRVRVERADLLELEVEEPVDVILSTATFHWIQGHERLFRRLARALKPDGRLVVQCGGAGNIERVRNAAREVMSGERFERYFGEWRDPWNFTDPETTSERLAAAGFEGIEAWLHEEPTELESVDELARYLKTVVLGEHVSALPEADRDPFVGAVARRIGAEGALVMDYVRLNVLATRGV